MGKGGVKAPPCSTSRKDDMTKVLYADAEVTLHRTGGEVELLNGLKALSVLESFTIVPGQFVALEELPPYQREAAVQGKIAGVRVMTQAEAVALAEHSALLRGEVPQPEPASTDVPDSVDYDEGEEETPVVEDSQEEVLDEDK